MIGLLAYNSGPGKPSAAHTRPPDLRALYRFAAMTALRLRQTQSESESESGVERCPLPSWFS